MNEPIHIEIDQPVSTSEAVYVHPRTEGDEVAEINTASATDAQFAEFAPRSTMKDKLVEPGVRRALGIAGMKVAHTTEVVLGGEQALSGPMTDERNQARNRFGLPPEK